MLAKFAAMFHSCTRIDGPFSGSSICGAPQPHAGQKSILLNSSQCALTRRPEKQCCRLHQSLVFAVPMGLVRCTGYCQMSFASKLVVRCSSRSIFASPVLFFANLGTTLLCFFLFCISRVPDPFYCMQRYSSIRGCATVRIYGCHSSHSSQRPTPFGRPAGSI